MKEFGKNIADGIVIKPSQIGTELFYMSIIPKLYNIKCRLSGSFSFAENMVKVGDTSSVKPDLAAQTTVSYARFESRQFGSGLGGQQRIQTLNGFLMEICVLQQHFCVSCSFLSRLVLMGQRRLAEK